MLRHVALLPLVVLLGACTASWRAPVETRGQQPPTTTQAYPATRPAVRTASPRPVVRGDEYRVRRGDTLHAIAWQSGIDHRSIAKWNGLRPPYRIYAGQTLRLKPAAARRVPPPASPPKAKPRPASKRKPVTKPKPTTTPVAANRRLRWSWPAAGRVVTGFRPAEPLGSGIKIAGSRGSKIRSAEAGKVVYSGSGLIGYGRLIIVKHNDKYLSAYGHNSKVLVAEGEMVTKGQKIAEMGTADNGDPLLHFEIRRDGKPVDPMRLLPRR